MRGVRPPRLAIQRRISDGYIEYSICVASGLVTARPLAPKSQAAWKPNLTVLSDARHSQRVARSWLCPDGRSRSDQIQIECCPRDAPSPAAIPNRNIKAIPGRSHRPVKRVFAVDRG